ncbi:sugar-binding protein [Flindersiella endophytica]
MLFIGAHPDDEAGGLSTYGQWREDDDVSTGVITVTRGEGGGNAVGPEEGPPLGLLREAEERRAVGRAGVTDVHNLDEVDFYYTVSEPLTRQAWGHDDTLAKVVRLVRQIKPNVIVTMNPAPSPGNHGNHQEAARLAVEAYYAAADPTRFPDQRLAHWQTARLFSSGAAGTGPAGPDCASTFVPTDPTADIYGVWSGRPSQRNGGKSWAQVEREAQREYASQGWAGFPDVPTDPNALGCDRFTQIDSRVPYTPGNTAPGAMLEGAFGSTRLWLTTSAFGVHPGVPFDVAAHTNVRDAKVSLAVPDGWRVERTAPLRFSVTPPANAALNTRARLTASLAGKGKTSRAVEVRPVVRGMPQLLPAVAQYEEWTNDVGVPQLSGRVTPVLTLAGGGSRPVRVDVSNDGTASASGTVRLSLPNGFAADAAEKPFGPLAAGESGSVTFTVTNTDASLPTSNLGGDFPYTITVGNDVRTAALELVPATTIPQATTAPALDGVETPGEYGGQALDLSRLWEGTACASAADCSATAKLAWNGDDLYVLVHVTDDTPGTVLDPADCKRHWRTDSVELAFDARGSSENTSTTFKAGIFPRTTAGTPCFERDADNRQGPGEQAAPGMRVAARVENPYTGYTIEAKVALGDLPNAVDPQRLGLNLFVYDSDTQDKTGQTRIGWSTWGGVQGDPYRWGLATLPGYTPPADRPTEPAAPRIPQDAARSVGSPQSILQAVRTRIPLAGGPEAPRSDTAALVGSARLRGDSVRGTLQSTGPGEANLFVWDPARGVLGSATIAPSRAGQLNYAIDVDPATVGAHAVVVLGFAADRGGTHSSVTRVG